MPSDFQEAYFNYGIMCSFMRKECPRKYLLGGKSILKKSVNRQDQDFFPMEIVQNAVSYWWVIVVFMLFGAFGGWGMHLMNPPIYQARASLATSIDFNRTGKLEDTALDQILGMNEDVITSPELFEKAADQAAAQGIDLDGPEFRRIASTDRSHSEWILRVIYPDADKAAMLANIWADVAYESLSEAYLHAIRAEGLLRYLDSLESCLEQSVASGPVQAFCYPGNLEALQSELEKTGKQAQVERLSSYGISTAVTFSQGSEAQVSSRPVQNDRNVFIFAGMGMGLLIGIWVLYLNLPARLIGRSQRA